jgi:hypothetical protein
MATRIALFLIVSAVLGIGTAYAAVWARLPIQSFAPYALAYGIGASTTGMFVLGAARQGRISPLQLMVIGAVFVCVTGTFWLVLGLPPLEGTGGPLLLGLPRRTTLVLLGVGVIPTFLLPIAYALTFDRRILRDDDVRALFEAHPPSNGEAP